VQKFVDSSVLIQKVVEQIGLRGSAVGAAPKGRNILAQGAEDVKKSPVLADAAGPLDVRKAYGFRASSPA
jgi:hypothetical protein